MSSENTAGCSAITQGLVSNDTQPNTPSINEVTTKMPSYVRDEVRARTTDLEMALEDFKQAGYKVTAYAAEVQSERNAMVKEKDALAETVKSQRNELTQSQAKIGKFESTIRQMQQQINHLQDENKQMQCDHKSKFETMTSLASNTKKNMEILIKAKEESDAKISSLTAKNNQLVKTFHSLQSERNKFEIQVNILTKVNEVSEEKLSSLKAKLASLKSDDGTINETLSISSSTLPLPEEIECSSYQQPPGTLDNPLTLDGSDVENDDVNLDRKPTASLHTSEKPPKKRRVSMVRELESCLKSPKKLRSHGSLGARRLRERMER